MKKSIIILFMLFSSASLFSQAKFGIGTALDFNLSQTISSILLYNRIFIPVDISNFRIEPSFSLYDRKIDDVEEDQATYFSFAAGFFYLAKSSPNSQFYIGPRFGVISISGSDGGFMLQGIVGGEWLPVEHFSLGLEVGVDYKKSTEFNYREYEAKIVKLISSFTVRYYF